MKHKGKHINNLKKYQVGADAVGMEVGQYYDWITQEMLDTRTLYLQKSGQLSEYKKQ